MTLLPPSNFYAERNELKRGHGLGVSLGVYAISDLEQKIEAVTKLEAEVTHPSNADSQRWCFLK